MTNYHCAMCGALLIGIDRTNPGPLNLQTVKGVALEVVEHDNCIGTCAACSARTLLPIMKSVVRVLRQQQLQWWSLAGFATACPGLG